MLISKKINFKDKNHFLSDINYRKFTHSPSPNRKNIKYTIDWNPYKVYSFKKDFYSLIDGIVSHNKINDKLINKHVRYFVASRDRSLLVVLKAGSYISIPNYRYPVRVLKIKGTGHYDPEKAAMVTPEAVDYLGPGFSRYEFNWDKQGNFNALKRTPWFKYGMRFSSAINEYNFLNKLISLGRDVPFPLAYGEYNDWKKDVQRSGFIITGYDSEHTDLIRLNNIVYGKVKKNLDSPDLVDVEDQENIYKKMFFLGGVLKNIHAGNIVHFQPHPGNISILERIMFVDWESAQDISRYTEIQKMLYIIYDLNTIILNMYKMSLKIKNQDYFYRTIQEFLRGYFPQTSKLDIENIAFNIFCDYVNKFDLKKTIFNSGSLANLLIFNKNKEIYNAVYPFFSMLITAEYLISELLLGNKSNGSGSFNKIYSKIIKSVAAFIDLCPANMQSVLKYIYSKNFPGLNL